MEEGKLSEEGSPEEKEIVFSSTFLTHFFLLFRNNYVFFGSSNKRCSSGKILCLDPRAGHGLIQGINL